MKELSSLGLNPDLLAKLLETRDGRSSSSIAAPGDGESSISRTSSVCLHSDTEENKFLDVDAAFPRVLYEFGDGSSGMEPRLRISLESFRGLSGLLPKNMAGGQGQKDATDASSFSVSVDEEEVEPTLETTQDVLVPPGDSLLWTLQQAEIEYVPAHMTSSLELISTICEVTSN